MTAPRKSRPKHGCGGCPSQWDGMRMCHCAECHSTFTGITAFDAHRCGSDSKRHCSLQELTEVRPGVYGQPSDSGSFWGDGDDGNE